MWLECFTAFRPLKIRSWTRSEFTECINLLMKRVVHVEIGNTISKADALIKVLYYEDHFPSIREEP